MVYGKRPKGDLADSRRKYRARWGYLAVSIVVSIIELITTLYVHDRIVRSYTGDTLVVVPVYCFVRVLVPVGMKRVSLYVFLFAVCVGMMQYFRLAEILGPRGDIAARITLGSVFDWKDIVCYGAGYLLIQIFGIRRRAL